MYKSVISKIISLLVTLISSNALNRAVTLKNDALWKWAALQWKAPRETWFSAFEICATSGCCSSFVCLAMLHTQGPHTFPVQRHTLEPGEVAAFKLTVRSTLFSIETLWEAWYVFHFISLCLVTMCTFKNSCHQKVLFVAGRNGDYRLLLIFLPMFCCCFWLRV